MTEQEARQAIENGDKCSFSFCKEKATVILRPTWVGQSQVGAYDAVCKDCRTYVICGNHPKHSL